MGDGVQRRNKPNCILIAAGNSSPNPPAFSFVFSLHSKAAATRGQCDHVNLNQLLGAAQSTFETGTTNRNMK